MFCARCGKELKTVRRDGIFTKEAHGFCSPGCLHDHITDQNPIGRKEFNHLPLVQHKEKWGNRNCHSTFLGVSFRSWFECRVAEYIVRNWNMQVFYEPHVLRLDASHSYLPDFWLPEYGVWLEVKGEWLSGSKGKFKKASGILGSDRLLLIPDAYKGWFSR